MKITEQAFTEMFVECSAEVADEFYPKGKSSRRGEYLRDQAVLCSKLLDVMIKKGLIKKEPTCTI